MNTNLAIINTSKIRGYKNAFFAVSLILIFAISIGMAFAPTASAQVGITQPRTTAGYIIAAPTLIGVGQQLTVNPWVCTLTDGLCWAHHTDHSFLPDLTRDFHKTRRNYRHIYANRLSWHLCCRRD